MPDIVGDMWKDVQDQTKKQKKHNRDEEIYKLIMDNFRTGQKMDDYLIEIIKERHPFESTD